MQSASSSSSSSAPDPVSVSAFLRPPIHLQPPSDGTVAAIEHSIAWTREEDWSHYVSVVPLPWPCQGIKAAAAEAAAAHAAAMAPAAYASAAASALKK